MAINITAPGFTITLGAPYTLTQLVTALKQGLTNCGFPAPTSESLGSVTNFIVYDFNFNPAKTYGKARFVLEASISGTTITLRARLHSHLSFNSTTFTPDVNTGANKEIGATFTVSTNNPLVIYCIPTSENIFGLIIMEAGVFKGYLGIARPSTFYSWYDEALFVGTKLIQSSSPNNFWSPFPNPLGASSTTVINSRIGIDTFSTRNPINGLAQVIKAPFLSDYTWGLSGQFSSDIALCNSTSYFVGDILQVTPGVEEYWLAFPGNNGLAYRIAN